MVDSGSRPVATAERWREGSTEVLKPFFQSLVSEGVEARMVEGPGFVYIETPGAVYGRSQAELDSLRTAKQRRLVPGFSPRSSLFIEDDSLHFDYGHALPGSKTCSVVHGHSGRASVEFFGGVGPNGMILDFADAKEAVRKTLKLVDHKFVISEKYVVGASERSVRVRFEGPNGEFELKAPPSHVVILREEATSENIAKFLVEKLLEGLPSAVEGVKLFVFEGVNKGASYFRVGRT
jgi:6-pyruvoyltetrahydropterin/6-carboxytetrahydropterin synthase